MAEGDTIYDYCWYPKMNSLDPDTCLWVAKFPIPQISAPDRHLKFIFKVNLPSGEQWTHTKGNMLFVEAGVSQWLVFLI